MKNSVKNMENSLNKSEDEDSLNISSKEWNLITDTAKKSGYREGIEDGANSVFQEGFDIGYKQGFQTAFMLGKFKSLLNIIPQDIKHPQNINEILDKTKRGACQICITESQNASIMQKSVYDIIQSQKTHSMDVLQVLHQYFQPYVKQLNISKADILEIQNHVPELEK